MIHQPSASPAEVMRVIRQALASLMPARHSLDFCSVVWFGTFYTFSAGQAAVVKLLWEAWENGTPDLRQETLLHESGSESRRIQFLFKDHPAWGTLVQSSPGVRGAFRLVEPATETAT